MNGAIRVPCDDLVGVVQDRGTDSNAFAGYTALVTTFEPNPGERCGWLHIPQHYRAVVAGGHGTAAKPHRADNDQALVLSH